MAPNLTSTVMGAKDAFLEGDYEQALKLFDDAIMIAPGMATLYADIALPHLKLGNLLAAIDVSDRAIALDPKMTKAHLRKATAYMKLREFQKARETLEYGVQRSEGDTVRLHEMIQQCDAHIAEMNNATSVEAMNDFSPDSKQLYAILLKRGYSKENAQIAMGLIGTVPKEDNIEPSFGRSDLAVIRELVSKMGEWLSKAPQSKFIEYETNQLFTLHANLSEKETLLTRYLMRTDKTKAATIVGSETENKKMTADVFQKEGKGVMVNQDGIQEAKERLKRILSGQEKPILIKAKEGKDPFAGKGKASKFTRDMNLLLIHFLLEAKQDKKLVKIRERLEKGSRALVTYLDEQGVQGFNYKTVSGHALALHKDRIKKIDPVLTDMLREGYEAEVEIKGKNDVPAELLKESLEEDNGDREGYEAEVEIKGKNDVPAELLKESLEEDNGDNLEDGNGDYLEDDDDVAALLVKMKRTHRED